MAEPALKTSRAVRPVNSHNEWDPLEEVIVGRLEGATIPPDHPIVTFNVPRTVAKLYRLVGGMRYPRLLRKPAQKELDEFIQILEAEGVKVRRPDPMDFAVRVKTPFWSSTGFCTACPRDGFLVVGDEIIESPMATVVGVMAMVPNRNPFSSVNEMEFRRSPATTLDGPWRWPSSPPAKDMSLTLVHWAKPAARALNS